MEEVLCTQTIVSDSFLKNSCLNNMMIRQRWFRITHLFGESISLLVALIPNKVTKTLNVFDLNVVLDATAL